MEIKEGYITLKELSRKVQIKSNTLYVWATEGRIKFYKEKNRIYVQDVDRADLLYQKTCPNCNTVFQAFRDSQKYDKKQCSSQYRSRNWARRKRQKAKGELE